MAEGYPGEILLWFMVSIIFAIITIFFIQKYRKMEPGSRTFIFGVIFFTAFFGLSRTIETFRRYFGIGAYYEDFAITGLNLTLRLIYFFILWAGIAMLYLVFETYVMKKKTKYLLTIFSIITCIFSISLILTKGDPLILNLNLVCFLIIALFPMVLFAYCSKTSLNKAQQIAWITMIIGFAILLIGVMGDTPEAYMITQDMPQVFVRYFTPIAEAIGAVIMAYSLSIIYKYI